MVLSCLGRTPARCDPVRRGRGRINSRRARPRAALARAHRGHGNVIRCLAARLESERGADVVRSVVDARDCDGIRPCTPRRVGARAALAALLEAGADATIKCEQGRTRDSSLF